MSVSISLSDVTSNIALIISIFMITPSTRYNYQEKRIPMFAYHSVIITDFLMPETQQLLFSYLLSLLFKGSCSIENTKFNNYTLYLHY